MRRHEHFGGATLNSQMDDVARQPDGQLALMASSTSGQADVQASHLIFGAMQHETARKKKTEWLAHRFTNAHVNEFLQPRKSRPDACGDFRRSWASMLSLYCIYCCQMHPKRILAFRLGLHL